MTSHITRSSIALGTMQFLWTTTERDSYKILDTYSEKGGNTIDTADMYSNWVDGLKGGEAETIIGKWLTLKKNRDKIFLITKVGSRMWDGYDGEGLSKAHIIKAVEQSLIRLQTDYIDLYLSHWQDTNTPIEETLLAYETLIKQGKVRYIGCSNYEKNDLDNALKTGQKIGTQYTHIQAYYNLIDRTHFENNLLPLISQCNLQTMIYGPLAGGFLSGAYRKNTPLPKHARAIFIKEKMTQKNLRLINALDNIARRYQGSVSQIALAWLLEKNLTPIIGADSINQVEENMGASEITLSKDDLKVLDDITSR